MATVTLNPTSNSGGLNCFAATYANARAGTGTLETGQPGSQASDARIGQAYINPNFDCWQQFLEFDLTPYAGATITGALLSLYDRFSDAAQSFTIECRSNDYGSSLTTADYVAGANLAALTKLAERTTASMTDPGYWQLTDVAMPANLVAGALNRMIIVSSRQTSNLAPSTTPVQEYFTDYYDNSGGFPPKLDLTYTPAATDDGPAFIGGDFF